jgi:hypothetical protein
MASGQPSTFQQAMQDIMGRLGSAMALPDADPKLIVSLQVAIAGALRQGQQGPPGGGASPPPPGGPPPGLQMPGAPGPGGPTIQPPQRMMGGLTPGVNPMATANNPDEMRRIIQQMAGA